MGSDTTSVEKAYTTKEIAIMLDIAEPTVRKYAQAMEKHGYKFATRKGTGKNLTRLFVEKDVSAMRYLKHLRDKTNITVDEASRLVIQRIGEGAIQSVATTDIAVKGDRTSDIEAIKELFLMQEKKHQEEIKELKELIVKQHDRIEKRLEERDKKLMEVMNQSLQAPKEEKRGLFSRLFGK